MQIVLKNHKTKFPQFGDRNGLRWWWEICDSRGDVIIKSRIGYSTRYSVLQAARRYGGRFGIDKVTTNIPLHGDTQCIKSDKKDNMRVYITARPSGWYWALTNRGGNKNTHVAEGPLCSDKDAVIKTAKRLSKKLNVKYTETEQPYWWSRELDDPTVWEKCVCNKTELRKHWKY